MHAQQLPHDASEGHGRLVRRHWSRRVRQAGDSCAKMPIPYTANEVCALMIEDTRRWVKAGLNGWTARSLEERGLTIVIAGEIQGSSLP